ncbi:guanylate cyclase 32E-like [Plodia interpunctella]|uniref:guanylate cyclase 32E-like n=1 Tax=Plodia interpunctella TaxID=58824 RepID=UPI00236773C7|nr:guanylate cyclase 32E-like [Plodia interpunctella]
MSVIIILTVILVMSNAGVGAKSAQNDSVGANLPYNTNETTDTAFQLNIDDETDNDNATAIEIVFKDSEDTNVIHKKSCEVINNTLADDPAVNAKILGSIYLNNIYSRVTTNLIDDKVSIDKIETNGVNLYDLVTSECGSAKVCPSLVANWTDDKTITIGFLGAYGRSQTVLGAMPLAVAAVNREPSLLPGLKLRFVAANIGQSRASLPKDKDSLTMRVMTQMRDLGVVAFFGPDSTCHTEAKLAAAWNLPLISHKCTGARGSHESGGLGATFARTLPPAYKVSKSVVALLKAFGWTKFAIVVGDAVTAAAQQMDAIKELAHANAMAVTAEHSFADYIPLHISDMERIVDQTYDKTRVYVFLGEHIALVDFVNILQRRELLKNGEYAVVAVDDEIFDPSTAAMTHADHLGQNNSNDIMGFRAVLRLTPSFPTNPHYSILCQMIRELSAAIPFCVPNYHKLFEDTSVPIEAAHLYDAVTLWARAATAIMRTGLPATDGATLMKLLRPTIYRSVQGFDVNMDSAGDAEGNFTVIGLVADPTTLSGWSAQPVATFRYTNSSDLLPELVGGSNIPWIGGKPPVAEPPCGFNGAKCSIPHDPGLLSAVAAVAAAAILAATLLFRHYRYEQKLASVLWRIEAKDLTFISACTNDKNSIPQDVETRRAHTTIALYRGNIVAIKRLQKKSIDVTRAIKKELKQIRELRHENLTAFVGVCIESGSACIVSAYCSRGSLARVLADRDLHLDDMFVASLVADLLRGLTYLHESALISHGNLTSSNCLVDSRWVLQIADYGLHNLKSGCVDSEGGLRMERRSLWRAPELLRDPNAPSRGSQKGDVYSFGILLYEILGRNGPWGDTNLTYAEIIGRVRQPIGGVLFRPPLGGLVARPSVLAVLNACWSEKPELRPDLRLVRLRLKDMHAGMKTNIFDNMLAMMEKYASNLEALVQARTEQLLREKRRTDDLLNRMLPRTVAEALKRGERVKAESYDCVTIYFSDIVGFTRLAATNSPMQVVEILNDLYTCCDAIISFYNVYKVETIGDAYMVVGGLPERCSRHAAEVASLALHVLDAVPKIRMRHMPAARLHIRIGIHSGQCAAGVVGVKMPRYCLFGDTVNTAARMESSGEPQKIHISNDTYLLLKQHGGYHFKERGIINIKGKGEMKTWWLVGEQHERRRNSLCRIQPSQISEDSQDEPWWSPHRSILNIRDRARLSCGGSLGPGSALSSPGPPACACFVAPRDHHSAPVVSFCED